MYRVGNTATQPYLHNTEQTEKCFYSIATLASLVLFYLRNSLHI